MCRNKHQLQQQLQGRCNPVEQMTELQLLIVGFLRFFWSWMPGKLQRTMGKLEMKRNNLRVYKQHVMISFKFKKRMDWKICLPMES